VVGGHGGEASYRLVRTVFGRSILLGLEFLVAADIIRTVAVQPSLQNVTVLGLIVLIRTFLCHRPPDPWVERQRPCPASSGVVGLHSRWLVTGDP
jgi:Protein of unknown function (DUF1622)